MVSNLSKFINGLDNLKEIRKTAMTEKFEIAGIKFIVDTCDTSDCGWETGIQKDDGHFIIVEEYPAGMESAKEGHFKWIKKIKENPNLELVECRDSLEWFFGDD